MITNVLETIQTEFQTNWNLTSIMYGSQDFAPSGEDWIALDIFPTSSQNFGMSTRSLEIHTIYITIFARNQRQASLIADHVAYFIQNRDINGIKTKHYRPRTQGPVVGQSDTHGSYYIKISCEAEVYCGGPTPVALPYSCSTSMNCTDVIPCTQIVMV